MLNYKVKLVFFVNAPVPFCQEAAAKFEASSVDLFPQAVKSVIARTTLAMVDANPTAEGVALVSMSLTCVELEGVVGPELSS